MGGGYIMKNFYERYKHAIPLMVYAVIYCVWFAWLEKKVINPPFIIHMKIDDRIPFLEVFVIPYFLWFAVITSNTECCLINTVERIMEIHSTRELMCSFSRRTIKTGPE